jgi:leucyl/phenylalanyl-tRNA--protein transferase
VRHLLGRDLGNLPTEPPPTPWVFPPVATADEDGIVGVGADLEPGTLLAAYRAGIFPTPVGPDNVLAWWSPDPRAVLPLDGLHVSRSLRRSLRRFTPTFDTEFAGVVAGCGDPARPNGWITADIARAYCRLHELGWAHSIEVWDGDGALAGGVYGVAIGGLFAGESMFHRRTDASKVALVHLVEKLRRDGITLFDVQWQTPHLERLGAVEIPRMEYLARLAATVKRPSRWSE